MMNKKMSGKAGKMYKKAESMEEKAMMLKMAKKKVVKKVAKKAAKKMGKK
jgi:hypothetical protein